MPISYLLNVCNFATRDLSEAYSVHGNAQYSTAQHSSLEGCFLSTGTGSGSHGITFRGLNSVGGPQGFNEETLWICPRIYVASNPTASEPICSWRDSSGNTLGEVRLTPARKLQIFGPAGTQLGSDSTDVMPLNQWHQIMACLYLSSPTGGIQVLHHCYKEVFNETFSNATAGTTFDVSLGLMQTRNGGTHQVYFDDIMFSRNWWNMNRNAGRWMWGSRRLDVNQDVAQGWNGSDPHYAQADDWNSGNADEDSTYLASTDDSVEQMGFENWTYNFEAVIGVKLITRVRDNTGTTRVKIGLVESGDVVEETDPINLSAAYELRQIVSEYDGRPGGDFWTPAQTQNMQLQLQNVSDPHIEARLTSACLVVFWDNVPSEDGECEHG